MKKVYYTVNRKTRLIIVCMYVIQGDELKRIDYLSLPSNTRVAKEVIDRLGHNNVEKIGY